VYCAIKRSLSALKKQNGHFAKSCPESYKHTGNINSYKPWTMEEDQQLATELDSGLSIEFIEYRE
jgi:hypothetical protein